MTNVEYTQALIDLRKKLVSMTLTERTNLRKVYLEAAKQAGEVIKSAKLTGLTDLSLDRWTSIKHDLDTIAAEIATATNKTVLDTARKGMSLADDIEISYITSAMSTAGLTVTGLVNAYTGINIKLVNNVVTSVYGGTSYSSRIWGTNGVSGDWLEKMRLLTSAGLAQGRDPVSIAKDLQDYVKYGPIKEGRWGTLTPESKAYIKRMGEAPIDYRAMRIVRTELHNALRSTAIENAEVNPAWAGLYDWVLAAGRINWDCSCPDLAADSPYTKENIPRGPHPLCMCQVRPRMIDRQTFLQYLKDYRDGKDSYGANLISSWAKKYNLEVS